MFIYKITNLINGKIYVGKYQRVDKNYLGSGIKIKNAINLYGKENFIRETLEDSIEDPEFLCQREIYWIAFYKANDPEIGYNLTEGGEGTFGYKHTEETKEKVALGHRGIKPNVMTISRYIGVSFKKNKNRWQANIKCKDINKGNTFYIGTFETEVEAALAYNEIAQEIFGWKAKLNTISQEEINATWEKENLPNPLKGIKLSDDHRAKISKSGKGRKASKETKDKMSLLMLGRKMNGSESKYIGVRKLGKKWVARLYYDGKTNHIGMFSTEIEAAKAYNVAALDYYKENAKLNRILSEEEQ
jgi:hypothetical protein